MLGQKLFTSEIGGTSANHALQIGQLSVGTYHIIILYGSEIVETQLLQVK
jgi:hypothetical protein